MVESLAQRLTADMIEVRILSTFRTMTILCIIFMVFCCILGFMGYGGGLLIHVEEPNKTHDQEAAIDVMPGVEQMQVSQPTSNDNMSSTGIHTNLDGAPSDVLKARKARQTPISARPMQIIPPDPISDSDGPHPLQSS